MEWFKKYGVISIFLLSAPTLSTFSHPAFADESDTLVKIWNEDSQNNDVNRQEKITQALKSNKAQLTQSDSPFSGPKNNQATLIVFADYGCMHCKKLAPVLEKLQSKNPELKIIHKELPILGAQSTYAAKAALAAQKQNKYLPINAELMKSDNLSKSAILKIVANAGLNVKQFESDLDSQDIEQKIEQNSSLAKNLTIETVPVMIVLNNHHDNSDIFFVTGNPQLKTLQNLVHQIQD